MKPPRMNLILAKTRYEGLTFIADNAARMFGPTKVVTSIADIVQFGDIRRHLKDLQIWKTPAFNASPDRDLLRELRIEPFEVKFVCVNGTLYPCETARLEVYGGKDDKRANTKIDIKLAYGLSIQLSFNGVSVTRHGTINVCMGVIEDAE